MNSGSASLRDFLSQTSLALVEITAARGSTPREAGTWMLVSATESCGTIGGGQLEYMAIDEARAALASGSERALDVPLGPEIGQCCGGRVAIAIRLIDTAVRERLLQDLIEDEMRMPHVYLFGGGHVGHALARTLDLVPVKPIVVETREEALDGLPASIHTVLSPMPEAVVRDASAGSAFVVLTHDHALDFLIVAEALKRHDAAYVGLIGSKAKRATFRSWYLKTAGGTPEALARLVSPIGGDGVADKRPAVIAALATAEIIAALDIWARQLPLAQAHNQRNEKAKRKAR